MISTLYNAETFFGKKDSRMSEPFDTYIDAFLLQIGPYGAALTFRLSPALANPGSTPPSEDVGVVRMSLEHLKAMTYIMKRQVDRAEEELGIEVPVSTRVLNTMQIAPEDWEKFWAKE